MREETTGSLAEGGADLAEQPGERVPFGGGQPRDHFFVICKTAWHLILDHGPAGVRQC